MLSGTELGFTTGQIGLLGSAHFLGFFVGCWWAPRLMGSVGHSRAFAAFTAMGAIGLMAHMMVIDPYAWALMRVASGLCIAGCYTVIEAWLQAKVTNETRGRALGTYRMVDTAGSLVAQLLIGVLAPASYVSYNLLALLCCAALLPLTLTRLRQPRDAGRATAEARTRLVAVAAGRGGRCRGRRLERVLPHGRPTLRHAGGSRPRPDRLFSSRPSCWAARWPNGPRGGSRTATTGAAS